MNLQPVEVRLIAPLQAFKISLEFPPISAYDHQETKV